MNLKILGAGIFLAAELGEFAIPPAWRKATRNMVMATAAIGRALTLDKAWLEAHGAKVGLVLGSNSGEMETSVEFLSTMAKTGMARPVLFQNSLHNATTGFASIHFAIRGPSFSVASGSNLSGECLSAAEGLLREGLCDICLVALCEVNRNLALSVGVENLGEGACALVLAKPAVALRLGFEEARDLEAISASGEVAGLQHPPFYEVERYPLFKIASDLVSRGPA